MSATKHVFEKFVIDGVDVFQNPAQVVMDKNIKAVVYYLDGTNMGTQPLKGEVSLQAVAGETVSIKITKPDATVETITALTDGNKAFSVSYTGIPGNHSATANIGEDSKYLAATSPPFTFTLTKDSRTITLHG